MHKTKHQSLPCEDKELSGSRDLSKTRWEAEMYALCARLIKRNVSHHLYHHGESQSCAQKYMEFRETAFLLQKNVLIARGMCCRFAGQGLVA